MNQWVMAKKYKAKTIHKNLLSLVKWAEIIIKKYYFELSFCTMFDLDIQNNVKYTKFKLIFIYD